MSNQTPTSKNGGEGTWTEGVKWWILVLILVGTIGYNLIGIVHQVVYSDPNGNAITTCDRSRAKLLCGH